MIKVWQYEMRMDRSEFRYDEYVGRLFKRWRDGQTLRFPQVARTARMEFEDAEDLLALLTVLGHCRRDVTASKATAMVWPQKKPSPCSKAMAPKRSAGSTPAEVAHFLVPTTAQYPDLRCVMSPSMLRFTFSCATLLALTRLKGLLALLVMASCGHALGQYEVSSWRDHFPYGLAHEVVVVDGAVVARTPSALFTVDTATYEVTRFVKGQGLSQSNPSALGYDLVRDLWIVAYEDGGIDLRSDWGVTNIPDLRIAQVVGSKRIHDITLEGDLAYLSSAVGVIVLDLQNQEIADTWSLTPPEVPVDARCVVSHEGQWLVGTDLGVLTAAQSDAFLANPDRWEPWDLAPDLGPVLALKRFADQWWMATEVPGSELAVMWRGTDDGLWEVVPGWDENGLPWGGMDDGPWILADDGTRQEGLLVASCCEVWGWNAAGDVEPVNEPIPAFANVQDLALANGDVLGRVWLASTVGGRGHMDPTTLCFQHPNPHQPSAWPPQCRGAANGLLETTTCGWPPAE